MIREPERAGSKILLIGGGGHCKSVLDTLLDLNRFSDIGIIDTPENIGNKVLDIPVIGCDEDMEKLKAKGFDYAFITLGGAENPSLRIKLFKMIEKKGFSIPNIIDRTAIVSKFAKMGKGIFVGRNSVINAGVCIEDGVIVNTSSIVEHGCLIESFSCIAPGAILCGEVKIGKETFVGAGSVIKQQVIIGSNAIIGMGSVVLHNISDNEIAYGNPCRELL